MLNKVVGKNKTVSKLRITYITEFDVGPSPEFSKPETLDMGNVSDGLGVCSPNQAEAQQSVHVACRTEVRMCPVPSLRGTFYHVVTWLGQEPRACGNSYPFPVQEKNALFRGVGKRQWKSSSSAFKEVKTIRQQEKGPLGASRSYPATCKKICFFSNRNHLGSQW